MQIKMFKKTLLVQSYTVLMAVIERCVKNCLPFGGTEYKYIVNTAGACINYVYDIPTYIANLLCLLTSLK